MHYILYEMALSCSRGGSGGYLEEFLHRKGGKDWKRLPRDVVEEQETTGCGTWCYDLIHMAVLS